MPEEATRLAEEGKFELKAFSFGAAREQTRAPRLVRIGLIQNKIVRPTTDPILDQVRPAAATDGSVSKVCVWPAPQRAAIVERLKEMTHAAYLCGVNVLCYQEACSESSQTPFPPSLSSPCSAGPFFFCTREKLPWTELAESAECGPTIKICQEVDHTHH